MNSLSISPSQIDGVVFVSQTPDYLIPATSSMLQSRLKIPNEAVAFDINYGCSGYIYGLFQASLLISSGSCNKVLVCAGDTTTSFVNSKDRSTSMLFGDAGSATIVQNSSTKKENILNIVGRKVKLLIIHGNQQKQHAQKMKRGI